MLKLAEVTRRVNLISTVCKGLDIEEIKMVLTIAYHLFEAELEGKIKKDTKNANS